MLIEAICKSETSKDFRCYFTFKESKTTQGTYAVRVANNLTSQQIKYIRGVFLKKEARHSHVKHGIICNFDPLEFIKDEFNVVTVYPDYYYLDSINDLEMLCRLEDNQLIDSNCIYEGERPCGNDTKVVYYLQTIPELDEILKPYVEKKRAEETSK